jgi:hypothetical protein
MKTEIYKTYDLESMEDFFDYIVCSKVNGNFSQVRRLISELTKEEKKSFINWCNASNASYPESNAVGDFIYCINIAMHLL